jgi:hypothetical protein
LGVGKLAWIGAGLQLAALAVLLFKSRPLPRMAEEDAA